MKVWDKSGMNSCWQLHEDVQGFGSEPLSYGKKGSVIPKNHVSSEKTSLVLKETSQFFKKNPWNHEASWSHVGEE